MFSIVFTIDTLYTLQHIQDAKQLDRQTLKENI